MEAQAQLLGRLDTLIHPMRQQSISDVIAELAQLS